MAKGNEAKQKVIDRIAAAFGDDYIGIIDKKIYVWEKENGEKVQIALTLTCPKNAVESPSALNFKDNNLTETSTPQSTSEDKQKIEELLARLGI